ncbi:ABC transporter ATP-binding protein [Alkalihalobacillus sp. LMS39]|uniref:ABC transporter ATP-binding protein n=1 Tax=Alkalihalobacillus sp. LMS39 TaxID=2924032 RepID=UPI001FB4B06F|nr:ABC transporter ATP-binding protein [Alkalihalobacillus sp. LMS39]UOE94741.1 ABC transporter ATP-binding protein [Alkalihalobacillus sp. LMS39]
MIKINNVSKRIKNQDILKNINLDVNSGDLIMLHGHNGSGKTMLLRLICQLIRPTSGTVTYEGTPRFGVIIENPNFFQNETAYYNLKYLASIKKIIGNEEIHKWLKTFNLYDVKDKKVKAFSLGMRQRLAMCQAFMENPDILLLDEPFNGIDDKNLKIIYDVLTREKKQNKIIVVASHVKIPISGLVTKEVCMSDGEIINIT